MALWIWFLFFRLGFVQTALFRIRYMRVLLADVGRAVPALVWNVVIRVSAGYGAGLECGVLSIGHIVMLTFFRVCIVMEVRMVVFVADVQRWVGIWGDVLLK